MLEKLNYQFGKISTLMTSGGKVLEYLGTTINYSSMEKSNFSCTNTLKTIGRNSTRRTSRCETPTSNHLFYTNLESKKLSEYKGHLFYHLVLKLLYLSKLTKARYTNASCISMYKSGKNPKTYD